MRTGSVIFGPRTRLAGELLRLLPGPPADRLLVVRDRAEAAAVADRWPGATVVPAWEPAWGWPGGFDRVAIYVCALGPIHPRAPLWAVDASAVVREIGVVEQALSAYSSCAVHLVFVSSALALVPGRPERRYYAGFKNVIEGVLAQLVDRHGAGTMSVVYPGRLMATRSIRRPASLLHTSFARLARMLGRIAARSRTRRTAVGRDARLLVLSGSAMAAVRALFRR
jgi:hypothetical protein